MVKHLCLENYQAAALGVSFTRHSQQDVLLTQPNKFPFSLAKGVISTAHVGRFSRALIALINTHKKITVRLPVEK